MSSYIFGIDGEGMADGPFDTEDRANMQNAILGVLVKRGMLEGDGSAHEDDVLREIADSVLDSLMPPTDYAIHHADGMSDFILPEPFENTNEARHAEMKNAVGHMIKYIKTGI